MTVATLTPEQVFNDPVSFAETLLKIQDKRALRVPLQYNHAQRIYLENRTRKDIILKARQLGFSTAILAEYFRLCTTRSVFATTITDIDRNTQNFRRRARYFWEQLPDGFRPNVHTDNETVSTYPDTQSEWRIATAGSRQAGRSTTNTHVHASEVAFWIDPRSIVKSLMQAGDPAIVYESTPNGAYGYFFDLCMETLDGREFGTGYFMDGPSGYRFFFFPWWVNAEYVAPVPPDFVPDSESRVNQWGFTPESELMRVHGLTPAQIMWRRAKIIELKDEFIQEYPEDPITCFLTSGSSYFGDLRGVFTVPPGETSPSPSGRHYAGLDFGQDEDWTVCVIVDAESRRVVDMYRSRREPWADLRRGVINICNRWNVISLHGEKNSMGSTNLELLRDALGQNRVFDFVTTNSSKADIMADLKEAIHTEGYQLLDHPILRQEMSMYQRYRLPGGGWRFSAPDEQQEGESVHDDTVIALALALRASQTGPAVGRAKANSIYGGW